MGIHDDGEGKAIDPVDAERLKQGCAELYKAAKNTGTDKTVSKSV